MTAHAAFDAELATCRKCAGHLASIPVDPTTSARCVEPRPIVSGIRNKPILLIGQAPGITEYESGKPFQGQAGQKIREIFREAGVADFDACVYSSAVVKCYPGRKLRKSGDPSSKAEDRVPSAEMIRNCRPFLERQVSLVDPKVIVTLGGLPLKAYLDIAGRKEPHVTLDNYVGKSQDWNGRTVVFFPHTSGGARWLNSQENRALFSSAKALLKAALIQRSVVGGA